MKIRLSDGTAVMVRIQRGQRPTARDIEQIEQIRDELFQLCPKCQRYRYRCNCQPGRQI